MYVKKHDNKYNNLLKQFQNQKNNNELLQNEFEEVQAMLNQKVEEIYTEKTMNKELEMKVKTMSEKVSGVWIIFRLRAFGGNKTYTLRI